MALRIDLSGKKHRFDLATEGLGKIHVRMYSYFVAEALYKKFPDFSEADSDEFMRFFVKLTSNIVDQDNDNSDDDRITSKEAEKLTGSDLEKFAERFLEKNPGIKKPLSPKKKGKDKELAAEDDTNKKAGETNCDYLKRLMHKQNELIDELISKTAHDASKRLADISGIKNLSMFTGVEMKGLAAEHAKIGRATEEFKEMSSLGAGWDIIQEKESVFGEIASIVGDQRFSDFGYSHQIAEQFGGLYPDKAMLDEIQTSICPPGIVEGIMKENYSPALKFAGMGIGEDFAKVHTGILGDSWVEQIKYAEDIVSSFKAHGVLADEAGFMQLSAVSALAESSIMGVQWENFKDVLGIDAHEQMIWQNQIADLAGSYSGLVNSFKNEVAVPSVVYEHPPYELFHSSQLLKDIAGHDFESEESARRDRLGNELYERTGDALCLLLKDLDSNLLPMLLGARETLWSDNSDKARHFTVSLRELFTHVLHKLAPDSEVRGWSDDPKYYHEGRPTRRARLTYISSGINHEPYTEFMQIDVKTALKFFNLFQGGTHKIGVVYTEKQLKSMLIRMESLLTFMLATKQSGNYE